MSVTPKCRCEHWVGVEMRTWGIGRGNGWVHVLALLQTDHRPAKLSSSELAYSFIWSWSFSREQEPGWGVDPLVAMPRAWDSRKSTESLLNLGWASTLPHLSKCHWPKKPGSREGLSSWSEAGGIKEDAKTRNRSFNLQIFTAKLCLKQM